MAADRTLEGGDVLADGGLGHDVQRRLSEDDLASVSHVLVNSNAVLNQVHSALDEHLSAMGASPAGTAAKTSVGAVVDAVDSLRRAVPTDPVDPVRAVGEKLGARRRR